MAAPKKSEILGWFDGVSTPEEANRILRKKAKEVHPDVCKEKWASRVMKELNLTYKKVLNDLEKNARSKRRGKLNYMEHWIEQKRQAFTVAQVLLSESPGVKVYWPNPHDPYCEVIIEGQVPPTYHSKLFTINFYYSNEHKHWHYVK